MRLSFDPRRAAAYAEDGAALEYIAARESAVRAARSGSVGLPRGLGWFTPAEAASAEELARIRSEAERVRETADLLVVVGIGGSNRGAQAAIGALGRNLRSPTRILWAGDSLSASSLQDVVAAMKGSSVVLNVIAKDFNTVEPGIAFRVLRSALRESYGADYASRVIATGSRGPGQLHELALEHGYRFLDFPADIGGRFSVLSAVGLLPMAVAGVDIGALLAGARDVEAALKRAEPADNPAVRYAAVRNLLGSRGFGIESLVFFEPDLLPFARWWTQLFAETEGKTPDAVFPTWFSYSEDLHAVGQYVQQGPRRIAETYLGLFHSRPEFLIEPSPSVRDGFDYLDGKPFDLLNRSVYRAALDSHAEDGVPCVEFSAPAIDERTMGELFYFFMFSAYVSAALLGVEPFTQDGVEGYKRNMYRLLGKGR